jgi:hypothetical protein
VYEEAAGERKGISVMAQYRTTSGQRRRQQTYTARGGAYVQGSAARRLEEEINRPGSKRRPNVNTARKNREKAHYMNFGYVLFLSVALIATGVILTGYISLQSDITSSIKNISRLESRLNTMKLDNDEEYSRITSSVDLEEVKRVAIQELGMRYAQEGQIITFSGKGGDYMRQVADIPD